MLNEKAALKLEPGVFACVLAHLIRHRTLR
jgi:hypothetical protein